MSSFLQINTSINTKKNALQIQTQILKKNKPHPVPKVLHAVALCLFMKAQSLASLGEVKQAKEIYRTIIADLPSAIYSDKNGSWNIAATAKKQLAKLAITTN